MWPSEKCRGKGEGCRLFWYIDGYEHDPSWYLELILLFIMVLIAHIILYE
jgi:hypothetical protein